MCKIYQARKAFSQEATDKKKRVCGARADKDREGQTEDGLYPGIH